MDTTVSDVGGVTGSTLFCALEGTDSTPFEGRYRDSLVYERTLLSRKRVVGIEVLCSVVYNKEETICPFVYKSPFYSIDTALFYSKKEYLFAWRDF